MPNSNKTVLSEEAGFYQAKHARLAETGERDPRKMEVGELRKLISGWSNQSS